MRKQWKVLLYLLWYESIRTAILTVTKLIPTQRSLLTWCKMKQRRHLRKKNQTTLPALNPSRCPLHTLLASVLRETLYIYPLNLSPVHHFSFTILSSFKDSFNFSYFKGPQTLTIFISMQFLFTSDQYTWTDFEPLLKESRVCWQPPYWKLFPNCIPAACFLNKICYCKNKSDGY